MATNSSYNLLPPNAAEETGGNLASIATSAGHIPASPAQDRTTAASPTSVRFSDGSAFYVGAKTGQLPTVLGQLAMAASISVTVASDQSALSILGLSANTTPATQNVTAQDTASTTTTGANSQSIITGVATVNSTASFALSSVDTVFIQSTGTWTGTLEVEVSMDGGTTWVIRGIHQAGTNFIAAALTANFIGHCNVGGCTNIRIRSTAAWTGNATLKVTESSGESVFYLANTPSLADGTVPSTKITVKAASTAVASTDTALGVGLHPSSPLPAGTNVIGGLSANQSVNQTQWNGTAVDTNSGAKSAGTLRVVFATDQPQLTNKLLVTPDANSSVNLAQIGGASLAFGQAAAASSIPVTLANEDVLDQYITGQSAQTTSGNNIILAAAGSGATDCQGYRSIALQVVPTGTIAGGALTFEGSNDNVNFVSVVLYDLNSVYSLPVSTYNLSTGATRYFIGAINFRYFRARISTVISGSGGSAQAFTMLRMTTFVPPVQTIAQSSSSNLNATIGNVSTNASSNGTTRHRLLSANSTNGTSVKNGSGRAYSFTIYNDSATEAYFKLYNKASAPTVGTDTPVETHVLNKNSVLQLVIGDIGNYFSTGIAYGLTGAIGDSDTTVVAANAIIVNGLYI